MPYNVIFTTEANFRINQGQFSLLMKIFVMFMMFLLFQSNFFVFLARGKGPKNSIYRNLFKTKKPKQKTSDP